ncbi:MAG: 5'-nucleotidase C-terminal domain-containing protein [Gemmatimonadota bacterium]|nr:5'-nucleotidase C-terminal domain-containing protein [Gemmatimonadota bacterium]
MHRPGFSTLLAAFAFCVRTETADSQATATRSAVELTVAATTDQHGRLRGWDYYLGAPDARHSLARVATIVDSLRVAEPGRVVLVDAGDLLQGNPLTYVAARMEPNAAHPVIAAMNAMGYDAAAIGNHEFNYGIPALKAAIAQAKFPFLAANVYRADGTRAYPASRMFKRAGVTVAIVGATTPGSAVWDRDKVQGKLQFRDIVTEVRAAVKDVRARGADVVIVTVHSGLNEPASYDTVATRLPSENVSVRLAREVDGIDLINYGHSHRQMADTTIGTTMLMQAKNWAENVAVAHLRLERAGSRWRVTSRRGELISTVGRAESPAVLTATQRAHEATIAYVTEEIGNTPVAWRADSARVMDVALTDFILEVQRRTANAQLASTAAFSLDASLDAGPITVAEVARLYPYENTLKAIRISGKQLKEYLEFSARYFGTFGTSDEAVNQKVPGYNFDIVSGATYTLDVSMPVGSRVTHLQVANRPVAPSDTFSLALNNYRQSGGGGYAMLAGAPVVYDGTVEIRQLLIDEVRRRGTIKPDDYYSSNWNLVPGEAIGPALAGMRANPFERATSTTPPAPRGRRIRILATNDFHGALEPRTDSRGVIRGGAVALAASIERASRDCLAECALVLLDGGDMYQGTLPSNLAYGRPVVELYNILGYTAAALGNHEFDWGIDTLKARMRDARYPILGANVRFADGTDVPWIPNDTLIERNGIRIGIIGLASTLTPRTTRAANVKGLRFDAPAPIVADLARKLRTRGAEAVLVVAHDGAFCDRTGVASCEGEIVTFMGELDEKVDAVVSGHTHSLIAARVKGIPVVQARSSGSALGVIDLQVGGEATITVQDVIPDSLARQPRVDSLVRSAVAAVSAFVDEKVAMIAEPMPRNGEQYALGNLIADAQRRVGRADAAVVNNGGIRTGLKAGSATYGELYEIQPFANTLHRLTVRGRDLRTYIERLLDRGEPNYHFAGIAIAYDPARSSGQRLRSLSQTSGKPIDPAKNYTIVMNDFVATGGDGLELARKASRKEVLEVNDLDALIGYLRALPQPVRPPAVDRVVVRP